jgi:KaiC/GvpD/RAD55 family RecA-like ATPase
VGAEAAEQRRVEIQRALTRRNVVLTGEPGSGKPTFPNRVAFELCRTQRGTRP